MTNVQQRAAARAFAEQWKGQGYEKGESQAACVAELMKLYQKLTEGK